MNRTSAPDDPTADRSGASPERTRPAGGDTARTGGPAGPGPHAGGAAARAGRHRRSSDGVVTVLAGVGLLLLVAGGIGARAATGSSDGRDPPRSNGQPAPANPSEPATATGRPTADGSWGPVSGQSPVAAPIDRAPAGLRPLGVRIPAIGVTATSLVPLRILPRTGELEAPAGFDQTGWYAAGPVPGEPGPAVIAGHVDSRAGPAVFFRLRELDAGDAVLVPRTDGTTVEFTVTGVERYPKSAFPTQKVHGPTPDRALRLITCGGSFDQAKRSYRDNIVVYAVRT